MIGGSPFEQFLIGGPVKHIQSNLSPSIDSTSEFFWLRSVQYSQSVKHANNKLRAVPVKQNKAILVQHIFAKLFQMCVDTFVFKKFQLAIYISASNAGKHS